MPLRPSEVPPHPKRSRTPDGFDEHDDDGGLFGDPNMQGTNPASMDFFSTKGISDSNPDPFGFSTVANYTRHRDVPPPPTSGDLDLNSQAPDLDCGIFSFRELLGSSPAGAIGGSRPQVAVGRTRPAASARPCGLPRPAKAATRVTRGEGEAVGRTTGARRGVTTSAAQEPAGTDEDETGLIHDSMIDLIDDDDETYKVAWNQLDMMQEYGGISCLFGTYYEYMFMNKTKKMRAGVSGYEWVMRTLNNPTACFNMFRMSKELFDKLHDVLVSSYGLKSTRKMSSVESLAMFLWIIGSPQSFRQAENRFERSIETMSRKFEKVLHSVYMLSADIIKPRDPEFRMVHPRLQGAWFSPLFNDCIGAIDGTHIPVVVPASKMLQHIGRHGYTSHNVLAICDFDMRFTFVVAGWPGSAHDMRVFNDAVRKYSEKFPHPPPGKYYLVDSGYPNRRGYLAPYKGTKYHLPEFRKGPRPCGKKEVFNYVHSSLRNVIERAFGVLKMKWRILLNLPSYPMVKQSKIIIACMALHNFIRESAMRDADFDMCDHDENYMAIPMASSSRPGGGTTSLGDDDNDMNAFRNSLADALFAMGNDRS